MRRFSQRNSLVTLNDINITPLLDLAFVLLIIFIITTPLLEQSLKLDLPSGGAQGSQVTKNDVRTVEVSPEGFYVVKGQRMDLTQVEAALAQERQTNPKMVVYIRADEKEDFGNVFAILNVCNKYDINVAKFAADIQR